MRDFEWAYCHPDEQSSGNGDGSETQSSNFNEIISLTGSSDQLFGHFSIMSLVDDFENAFQACLAPFTNPTSSHVFDNDELKANHDNITRFLEISRQIESFFIQRRAILADQRPELFFTEEINELKIEIQRKDLLLNKYHEKLNKWTSVINDTCNGKLPNHGANLATNPAMMPMASIRPMLGQQQQSPMSMSPMNQMKVPVQGVPNVNSPMAHAPSPMMNPIRPQNSPMVGSPMNAQQMQSMQFNTMPPTNQPNQNVGGLQGPLAYLERTTSNIGMLDNRR